MFAVETLPAQYYEERAAAAEAARRLAQQQQNDAAAQPQSKAPTAPQAAAPSSLSPTLHPPLSRPGSSSVLGSLFQGFVKRASTPSPSAMQRQGSSMAPSRTQTPSVQAGPEEGKGRSELEARLAEIRRDADICALPSWH